MGVGTKKSLTIINPQDDTSKLFNDAHNSIAGNDRLNICDRERQICLILVLVPRNLDTDSKSTCWLPEDVTERRFGNSISASNNMPFTLTQLLTLMADSNGSLLMIFSKSSV